MKTRDTNERKEKNGGIYEQVDDVSARGRPREMSKKRAVKRTSANHSRRN